MKMPKIKLLDGVKKIPVDIKRDFYSMATLDGDAAEVVMYGDVVEERPVDWWTGEEIEGNFIILSEFMADLDLLVKAKEITLRINSAGGSVYAALPIYNRLCELKAEITAIVDGVAMSAASFIMCAADKVKVNKSSIVMIHKAATILWGWYSADEARDIARTLDVVDKAIATAYIKKTGASEDEILSMMTDTTYMTGEEAVDKGFADDFVKSNDTLDIAASADGQTLYVSGRALRLPFPISELPQDIQRVNPEAGSNVSAKTNINQPGNSGNKEGGTQMLPKAPEELKAQNLELYETLLAEARAAVSEELGNAVASERKRIQAIDEIANLFDDETVNAAKYGDTPRTAQEMTHAAAVAAAQKGNTFLKSMKADTEASGAQEVSASESSEIESMEAKTNTEAQAMASARAVVKKLLGKEQEEK